MTHIARQFGVSNVAIAKRCRKLYIPVPPRGYWNKLQAGKRVTKKALRDRRLSTPELSSFDGLLPMEFQAFITGPPGEADNRLENIEQLEVKLRARLGTVSPSRGLYRVDPQVGKLLKKDKALRLKRGLSFWSWHKPRFDDPFERRRLRIINSLLLAFTKMGARGGVQGIFATQLTFNAGDFNIHFRLDSPSRQPTVFDEVRKPFPATEKLCLTCDTCDGVKRWCDEKGNALEQQLTEVAVAIALAGARSNRLWHEGHVDREQERLKSEEQAMFERQAEVHRLNRKKMEAEEKRDREDLVRDAKAWRDATEVRAFVEATRESFGPTRDLEAWTRWARSYADQIDPMKNGRTSANVERQQIRLG